MIIDKHNIRVLTRSKSKAKLIFPGKKVIHVIVVHVLLYLLTSLCLTFKLRPHFVAREFPGIMIAEEPGWKDCIQGSDGVVNLAGMPISTRWSSEVSTYFLRHD